MISELSERVAQGLLARGWMLATAESCTGGWIAKSLTDLAGSSAWFDRGFVTYSNDAKHDLLGVSEFALQQYGAVSEQVAREMAIGALLNSGADVALSVTGIAGPTGGTADKPVGTVCFAWAVRNEQPQVETRHFAGERDTVRASAVEYALQRLVRLLG